MFYSIIIKFQKKRWDMDIKILDDILFIYVCFYLMGQVNIFMCHSFQFDEYRRQTGWQNLNSTLPTLNLKK